MPECNIKKVNALFIVGCNNRRTGMNFWIEGSFNPNDKVSVAIYDADKSKAIPIARDLKIRANIWQFSRVNYDVETTGKFRNDFTVLFIIVIDHKFTGKEKRLSFSHRRDLAVSLTILVI